MTSKLEKLLPVAKESAVFGASSTFPQDSRATLADYKVLPFNRLEFVLFYRGDSARGCPLADYATLIGIGLDVLGSNINYSNKIELMPRFVARSETANFGLKLFPSLSVKYEMRSGGENLVLDAKVQVSSRGGDKLHTRLCKFLQRKDCLTVHESAQDMYWQFRRCMRAKE